MTLIKQIKRDREAGTDSFHWIDGTLMTKEFGETITPMAEKMLEEGV